MKKKIYNPTYQLVDLKLSEGRVTVPPQGSTIVDSRLAKELQELQPQLHYLDVVPEPKPEKVEEPKKVKKPKKAKKLKKKAKSNKLIKKTNGKKRKTI